MLINGIPLSSLGISLYDRVLFSNDIDTKQEWLDGDIQPTFIRQQDRFKIIKLEFLVLCSNEDEAVKRISRLTALLKKATIKFDDLDFTFDTNIIEAGEPTRLKNGNFVVPYTLSSGYAKGQREVYTTNANMTNSFKLTIVYYKDGSTILSTESVVIRASAFDKPIITLEDLGIDINRYQPKYYNNGIATNFIDVDLTYENLQNLEVLIVNYEPIIYNLEVSYHLDDGQGFYNEILSQKIAFTQPELSNYQTIGQLVRVNDFRPVGYKAKVAYDGELELNDLLAKAPIAVFYDKIETELSKNISITYKNENDNGEFDIIQSVVVNVSESQFYDGLTLKEIVNIDAYRPNTTYYNTGYIDSFAPNALITYENIETSYTVIYTKSTNIIYVEYYAGVYPNWYRLSTTTLSTKYLDRYNEKFDILTDLGLDLNKYHTAPYNDGVLYNQNIYQSYDDILNAGVLQVYYTAIDYPITVNYYVNGPTSIPIVETHNINALMFFGNPILSDIIPILSHRPEGYQFSQNLSYSGEVSLDALTQASPIAIIYEEIEVMRSKNIIVRYKKELSSTYSTITTNLITINEADIVGGVRLKDIINLDAYRPDYYDSGIIDGASSSAITNFDALGSAYDVLYVAKSYTVPVRYYIDEIDNAHWVGSASLGYRVIDFEATTTLFDFGLDLNAYKPSYAGDGVLQYTGPVNFSALLDLQSIDILYLTETAPPDEDGIDYPHRFLYLQHNDLGSYENLHPEWAFNHAFINTGISAEDMSRLTVIVECARADENIPMYQVNAGYAYLFGSTGTQGSFYMRYNNQTMYGEGLTGVDTYEAKAGNHSEMLALTAENAIGFSENTGIYSSAQEGYSRATFTYSNLLATDGAPMTYPLYLFANNNYGSYSNGIAGVGIYSCRIYYDDQLIRDFIPVQYYDKIGELVAPSNCLYDKITKTFFEDGSKLNSFKIRNDDRYTDTNLQHKIGYCYVNYYKGADLLKTAMIYFRGDEFDEGEFDLYQRFFVDENQPQYTFAGEIDNIENIDISFTGLNNQIFKVIYEPVETQIVVNYYKVEDNGEKVMLASDTIALTEKDFYQVPTFGDLVRLNKYKPDGYETNFKYTGSKVSLARVVEGSPYTIDYTKMVEDKVPYSTTIKYIKKVYGVREYETIATKTLILDQSDFRDGEYIDFYIDKNLMKPDQFYADGITYQWYEMDERLTSPEDLKELYTIAYLPEPQNIEINYFTDEADEENLIASTTWSLKIDDLDPSLTYSIVEILPNSYINKYKPLICSGGVVQNADIAYTFESLVAQGHINIIYETIIEPNDPTQAHYEKKILCFGNFKSKIPTVDGPTKSDTLQHGGIIPYIDLGYRPKELGRLKVEIKAVAQSNGFLANTCSYGWQDTSYVDFFGYRVPKDHRSIGDVNNIYNNIDYGEESDLDNFYSVYIDNRTKGHFSFSSRVAEATGWTFTSQGPQSLDGQLWYSASSGTGVIAGHPAWLYYGTDATFRRGLASIYDENWDPIECYKEYGKTEKRPIKEWVINPERYDNTLITALANPITTVLDAYNGYWSSYTEEDSNHATYEVFENLDKDIFEARLQPKGSLSLFRTTNPLTGDVNIMAHFLETRLFTGGAGTLIGLKGGNPYTGGYKTVEVEVLVKENVGAGSGTDDHPDTNKAWVVKKITRNIDYANFAVPVYPQLEACAVWSVKIWDQDRLVRDLIPVAKGDKIYDYVMPATGMFDLTTEIFFGNANEGGTYELETYFPVDPDTITNEKPQFKKEIKTIHVKPEEVLPFYTILDPAIYGNITMNYYDYDYTFLGNQYVSVPTWFSPSNTTFEEIVSFNDMKPSEYHLDGFLDVDMSGKPTENITLEELYQLGSANVYYKLKTFTKTVIYYQGDYRVGSKDIFYSLQDIQNATSLADLGIDLDLYWTEDFAHGEVIFNEDVIKSNDIQAFIDAPAPIVVYKKLSKEEAPNLFYVEYYRGGASDETLITPDPDNENYFDCNLDGVVLNPNGAIKYYNHYHSALYEDEVFDYFIPYQVKVVNKYVGIHRGPARRFPTLATIVEEPTLTIIEERNGWGRLKEYPVGWIMLNATEPITGPGQNPDYDIAGEEVATIPFAQEVHISKMTVDRLWCYVPEVQSWVKAEDLSFNQSGKLYNSLAINVIDLNNIDFTTITNITDMGIYPNGKALYFHDKINYTYNGDFTYEAFADLHQIDFIYPETIYNYRCLYYKDNVMDEIKQGEVAVEGIYNTKAGNTGYIYLRELPSATSTIVKSTYWDGRGTPTTFYITSDKVKDAEGNDWYEARLGHPAYDRSNKIYEGYVSATNLNALCYEVRPMVLATETITNYLGSASFSCSIGDWNPDWDTFIATSWLLDEEGNEITPTLYRDTELALTWDYFGFEKNLYKPDGYPDGIYLWNPRTWENDGNIHFTFRELVRMGTQYVLYPFVEPTAYKIFIDDNITQRFNLDGKWLYGYNDGIRLDLALGEVGVFNDSILDDPANLIVDYTVEGELNLNEIGILGVNTIETNTRQYPKVRGNIISYNRGKTPLEAILAPGFELNDAKLFSGVGADYSVLINMSNFRKSPTAVYGFANEYQGKPYDYYIYYNKSNPNIPIYYNTKLDGYNTLQTTKPTYEYNGTNYEYPDASLKNYYRGVVYGAQSYQNFLMKHYWVPVPKGLWYKYNGVEMRITDNGMIDLMTGIFQRDYRKSEGSTLDYVDGFNNSHPYEAYADGASYIFRRNQRPIIGTHFDYFETWNYHYDNIDYVVKTTTDTQTFHQPDLYATNIRKLVAGLVFPVSRVSADAENKVVGEWYYSCDQWFESKNATIYAGTFDKTKLTKLQQTICVVKPKESETYYVYLDPSAVGTPGEASDASYASGYNLVSYYNYIDTHNNKYYFDGSYWVPEKYTSFNTTELNKNYAVVPDNLPYYSAPIEEDTYIAGSYHYGERITVPYVATQDTNWGYTGLGWIRLNNSTVSEIL